MKLMSRISFIIVALLIIIPESRIRGVQENSSRKAKKVDTLFRLGCEHISPSLVNRLKTGRKGSPLRIGIVMNQTSVDQKGRRTLDLLLDLGLQVTVIFAPEHGITGTVEAGEAVKNDTEKVTGIPVISLYKGGDVVKNLTGKESENVDVFMFDLQDSGMRHYTYSAILQAVLQGAAHQHKEVIVLDRPNPLGIIAEGSLIDASIRPSFCCPLLPVRHALTMGELARFFNTHVLATKAKLTVVSMRHYRRDREAPKTLEKPLSPNITSIDSCYGYSFLGMLGEVAPFDVGVGTDKAFQVILLPDSLGISRTTWEHVAALLKPLGITATPYTHMHPRKNIQTSGLTIHIESINDFSGMRALLCVLMFFKDVGITYTFTLFFDTAVGTGLVRELLEGVISYADIEQKMKRDTLVFIERSKRLLLYEPIPSVCHSL